MADSINTINVGGIDKEVEDTAARTSGTQANSRCTSLESSVSNLAARVEEIIAPTGEAPSPAEIVDARITVENETKNTLGDAIRSQISRLDTETFNYFAGMYRKTQKAILYDNLQLMGEKRSGEGYNYSNGKHFYNSNYTCFAWIPVYDNHRYSIYGSSNCHFAFFDVNKSFISGRTGNSNAPAFDITPPSGAAYMCVSNHNSVVSNSYVYDLTLSDKVKDENKLTLSQKVKIAYASLSEIITTGKNIFNCNDIADGSNILIGNSQGTGGYGYDNLSNWGSNKYFYPIKPSTAYVNTGLYLFLTIYDKDFEYIGSYNMQAATYNRHIITPENAAYVRFSWRIDQTIGAASTQFEEGENATYFEPFHYKFVHDQSNYSRVLHVGNGRTFSTITDAYNSAEDGDTILVHEGTYDETVHAYTKKVHIKGIDREKCILTHGGLSRFSPPLEMASGSLENMTIIATDSGDVGENPAYCLHIDYGQEENNALTIRNVTFYHEAWQAVGIGLRHNFTLTFENCSFKSDTKAGLYCHDWETSDTSADKSGQKLIVRNCTIEATSDANPALLLQSQELATDCTEVTFERNIVVNHGTGANIGMVRWAGRTLTNESYLGSSDWKLANISALNTESLMNKF